MQQGFTLIEIIVVIVIISILTLLGVYSLPIARDHQKLVADTNQLQIILREAERRAVNEIRPPECLELAGGDQEIERNCSNVGIALQGNRGRMFSDVNGNDAYDEGADYVIEEYNLRSSLEAGDGPAWVAIVFVADPPNIAIRRNGEPVPPNVPAIMTFTAGSQSRTLHVFPLRHVDLIEDATN